MAVIPNRGEVWLVNLGYVAKIRPCLVLSTGAGNDTDRVLTTIVPHTTSIHGSRFEVSTNVRFLKSGVFDCQNIVTIPSVKLIRKLGILPKEDFTNIEQSVRYWLGLDGKG